MDIHELSFQSISPIPTVSYHKHRIALKNSVSPNLLASTLGKLANRLRQITKAPVVADNTEVCLISPHPLQSDDEFDILSTFHIDITGSRYHHHLQQMLNQCICDYFRANNRKIDAYKHEAFLETTKISSEIEAQRVLKWDIRIDSNNHVFITIDYSNDYYSFFMLDSRAVSSLYPEQSLMHIYDNKFCRYAGIANFTVSEPIPNLGNVSLLEFHRNKKEVSEVILNGISPETPAILVNYGSKGKDVIYPHIPNLLKKTFTKDDIESKAFNAQVLSINERFNRAIKGINSINKFGGLNIPGIKVVFNNQPHKPSKQINYTQVRASGDDKKYQKNLDFGNNIFGSYPSQGLAKNKLFEKHESPIKTVILHSNNFDVFQWCNLFKTFLTKFNIQLELIEFRSYPVNNTLEIQRSCREVSNYDLALMFVPDKEKFTNNPKSDPYPILKREFIKVMLPSQSIEESTVKSGFNNSIGDNLLLKILGKLGYCPWQLKNMPGKVQAFLGLDIGRKEGLAVGIAAFVVSPQGKVIGWFPATFQAHRETFDISALRQIIFDLVELYERQNQNRLRHLVIHRDGHFQSDEIELLDELLPELNAAGVEEIDAVEIIKSGYPRAGQWNEKTKKWENPRRGWAWCISDTEMALMTTGQTEIKGGTNFVPRPIIVKRRRGNTTIGVLSAQVYWLSEMHVGSTQTIRLPITTYYADKGAECALEKLLPTGLQIGGKIPF